MIPARLLLAVLALPLGVEGPRSDAAPFYSEASIANAATHTAGPFAPNVIATVYGTDLARSTQALSAEDVSRGYLPTEMAGVRVLIGVGDGGQPAGLYFVSPNQINFLIRASLSPGAKNLTVVRQGVRGPFVPILLQETAPAPFLQADSNELVATRADYSLISRDAPARPGEIVILWASGLGRTVPPGDDFELAKGAAWLERRGDLRLSLAGETLDAGRILYAGLAPGFAGLYQINFVLPDTVPPDPKVRLEMGGFASPPDLVLRVGRLP